MTILDIRLAVRDLLGSLWDEHYGPGDTYADLAERPALAEYREALLQAHADWLAESISAAPTATGLARYTEDPGHYTEQVVGGNRYACVCASTCSNPCRGRCTCAACGAAWRDFDEFGGSAVDAPTVSA
jgi:hypothetical protein